MKYKKPPKVLWVIVDVRGYILEKGDIVRTMESNLVPDWPGFSSWDTRESAREIIRRIKAKMTKYAWSTWKFRAVKYQLC